jgi:hypothetical protein
MLFALNRAAGGSFLAYDWSNSVVWPIARANAIHQLQDQSNCIAVGAAV